MADPPLRRVTVATGVLRLLLEVLHAGECVTDTPASPDINLVIAYIDEHLATPLPVTALAELMHLSLSQFKARFKHDVGIPPAEYVLRRKIERAKALLVQPGCRVTDLAYTLGFSSSQYFATVFKRFTLVSPTTYQRRAGGGSQ